MKTAIALGTVSSLPVVLSHEGAAQERLARTEDHRGAVEAFLAKQKPTFTGR